ncbi:hypothetical protein MLD38_004767 [Melastoma candidum]|uniref:Uncharacterized protein n=1 Tax=Melastoma candidum TaxID=119954 RepID=A0ACB9SAP0_9MYRT|nr:hypothetical protein MLD38_004767 [Melastoma candidum]
MAYHGCSGWRRRLPSPPPCRCRCSRGFGFRLRRGKRFTVQRLRTRFMSVFGILEWLRRRYKRALRLFRCRGGGNKNEEGYFGSLERNGSSRVWLIQREVPCSTKSCGFKYVTRSNTFHTEAIADCLEFIKGTYSASSVVVSHGGDERYIG